MSNVTPFNPNAVNPDWPPIKATPFPFIDPAHIPRREWIFGDHYVRKFVSATVAPGGTGKSSLVIAEALALTSGRLILNATARNVARVWYHNGEDPMDELQRRVTAAMLHHGMLPQDIGNQLFVTSGRDTEMVVVSADDGKPRVDNAVVNKIIAELIGNGIDVLIIDPFVSCHRVNENDNPAIDLVTKTWGRIAQQANCAIELVHHSRKANGNDVTVDHSRGASALVDAVRCARMLNVMTDGEANEYLKDVPNPNRHLFIKVTNGKANMSPLSARPWWYRLVGQPLPNGDVVGVVETWTPPKQDDEISDDERRVIIDAVRGRPWRTHHLSPEWVGRPIGGALGLDPDNADDKRRIKAFITKLVKDRVLAPAKAFGKDRKEYDHYELAGPDLLSAGAAEVRGPTSTAGGE